MTDRSYFIFDNLPFNRAVQCINSLKTYLATLYISNKISYALHQNA